jgi:hypothetical protein
MIVVVDAAGQKLRVPSKKGLGVRASFLCNLGKDRPLSVRPIINLPDLAANIQSQQRHHRIALNASNSHEHSQTSPSSEDPILIGSQMVRML